MFLEEGMNVKVVLLPDGEDPDSFSRSRNSFDFNLFMKENEVDFIRFKVDLLMQDAADDPIKKAALIKNIMESVAVIPDKIVRSVYIKECSYLLDEREQTLINEVARIRLQQPKRSVYEKVADVKTEITDSRIEDPKTEETTLKSVEVVDNKLIVKSSPFKKYEAVLIQYVIREGEKLLFDEELTVAQYIQSELDIDDLALQTPLYKLILDEAVTNSEDANFTAQQYFLTNPDSEISRLAADMISSKYQLSRYFLSPDDSIESQKEEDVRKEAERKKAAERELLERQIRRDILSLKNAYINHKIKDLNKKIERETIDESILELMKEKKVLNEIRRELSKELGERVVTGMG
jgi:DNA primase